MDHVPFFVEVHLAPLRDLCQAEEGPDMEAVVVLGIALDIALDISLELAAESQADFHIAI